MVSKCSLCNYDVKLADQLFHRYYNKNHILPRTRNGLYIGYSGEVTKGIIKSCHFTLSFRITKGKSVESILDLIPNNYIFVFWIKASLYLSTISITVCVCLCVYMFDVRVLYMCMCVWIVRAKKWFVKGGC